MATPYSWGFRRGEGNYQYQEFLKRRMEAERQADFADRIAAEKERISLEQWQPKADETEVKIKTKADGTSTIVSTEKFPAQSLLDDPMGLEGTGTGDWGLSVTGDTISQAEIAEYNRINDLYAMGGQGDVGEVWPSPTVSSILEPVDTRPANQQDILIPDNIPRGWKVSPEVAAPEVAITEPVVSPQGTPLAGFDMGGLQRFEPHIIPDEAYRQAYGDQERVMGMRGLLEEEIPPVIVPPPALQAIEPQPQTPMVNRAIEQVDRGTANILPPMGDMPPTLPNWLTGMGEAEAPFVAPQAITPEQGPLGPPGTYSAPPWDRMGLLTDEEILAGGLPPVEGAYDPRDFDPMAGGVPEVSDIDIFAGVEPEAPPLTSEDIFSGVSPITPVDPVDPSLRPRGRVETDILESQVKGWVDPDTGLKPAPGKIRTRQEIRGDVAPDLPRGVSRGMRGWEDKVTRQSADAGDKITEEDIQTGMILDPNLAKVAESVDTLYKMQKQTAMLALMEGMKRKDKARSIRGVGRRRQGRQMQLLNPTPLQMEA